MQDSRRFEKIGICEETPLFESCADIIAMMTLKKAVNFSPLIENSGRCTNPNDLKRRQLKGQSIKCAEVREDPPATPDFLCHVAATESQLNNKFPDSFSSSCSGN